MNILGTCNLEQDEPHAADAACRDWNPLPAAKPDYAKNTYEDMKQEALKQIDSKQPSTLSMGNGDGTLPTTQGSCLSLTEQVKTLEERYAKEHAWLNEAAELLGCDLDQVAYTIRTNMYRATWGMPPL